MSGDGDERPETNVIEARFRPWSANKKKDVKPRIDNSVPDSVGVVAAAEPHARPKTPSRQRYEAQVSEAEGSPLGIKNKLSHVTKRIDDSPPASGREIDRPSVRSIHPPRHYRVEVSLNSEELVVIW